MAVVADGAGIKETSAVSVLAEVGPGMGQLGSEKNMSSWAGVCPGNNRSAGKNKGSQTTKGKRWLRGTLTECAWGLRARRTFSEAEVLAAGDQETA